ncbi:FAD-dependent oxidoreductase [Halobium salinum]|uniref:Glycerol-3-phosphate dehydrogenase n=1 Tax=Halobium salinum TaxID=1364940 RepID=A0ABD5P9E6_9EURY
MDTTVLVVGGGATGVGVARDLAMRGVDVTLVERGGLGSGTSGRSHGLLHSGARYAEADPQGARECIAENRIIRDIAPACVRDSGGLFVSLESDDPAYYEAKRDACREHDIPVEELSPEAARERVPDLADDAERVFEVPDGVVYPSRLVAATGADAREHGARIATGSPLLDFEVEGGRVVAAEVGGELDARIEPEYVVNAAGAWAGECAALAGLDVEMRPTQGVMVGVDYPRLGPVLNRCRDPDDGDIVIPHDDRVVLGTTSVAIDDPDEMVEDPDEVERTIRECAAMLPSVADVERLDTYWGVRPLYAPDEDSRGGERGISRGFFLLDGSDGGAKGGSDAGNGGGPGTDDGVENFLSVVGGKLTTHRLMAEAATDRVCAALGVDAKCRTAEEPLVAGNEADAVDRLVAEFDAQGPADADVVGPADD